MTAGATRTETRAEADQKTSDHEQAGSGKAGVDSPPQRNDQRAERQAEDERGRNSTRRAVVG